MIDLKALVRAHRAHTGRRDTRIRRFKPVVAPHRAELWYKVQLLTIVKRLRVVTQEVLYPILKETEKQYTYTGDASYSDRIASGIESMSKQFGGIQQTANRLAQLAIQRAKEETDERFVASVKQAIGIDVAPVLTEGPVAEDIARLTYYNVNLIKSIPEQYLDKVANSVYSNTGKGMRYEDIISDIQRIGDITESRAKLIARDQTSKMNAAVTESRQSSLGIKQYTWRTSGDERVRDSHAANDGQVFSWDDPPEDTGHPGQDINCRCTAEPYINLDEEEENLGIETEADDE